ncbi:MAG: cob(I)alamin adenosyltransferase [Patiriisocius sp.]|jgi:cob(I)alamin adenosyltransferase
MKIYTKTGDGGQTSLVGGTRVSKGDPKIEAYGTVDELNSWIGLLGDFDELKEMQPVIREIQENLFVIGSNLAAEENFTGYDLPDLVPEDTSFLEKGIDKMNEDLPKMTSFILPGGHKVVSNCHIARSVCRRAERMVIRLSEIENIEAKYIIYLNRLSDFLFVLARKIALEVGANEVPWKTKG